MDIESFVDIAITIQDIEELKKDEETESYQQYVIPFIKMVKALKPFANGEQLWDNPQPFLQEERGDSQTVETAENDFVSDQKEASQGGTTTVNRLDLVGAFHQWGHNCPSDGPYYWSPTHYNIPNTRVWHWSLKIPGTSLRIPVQNDCEESSRLGMRCHCMKGH